MLLEEDVLAAVAAIGIWVAEMLIAIELDDEARGGAEEIDFHAAAVVEGDGKAGVEFEFVTGGRKTLEALIEKTLAGTAGLGVMRPGDMDEESGQRWIDAIADEAADAGGVVAFPLRIERERNLNGPTRQRAGGQEDGVADGFVACATAVEHP